MIIGLSGYARSGKDEAAKGLERIGFHRVAFADKLREFLYKLNPILPSVSFGQGSSNKTYRVQEFIDKYGWDGYKDPDPYEKHISQEIRQLLQRLGTECGRETISDTIWIDAALGSHGSGLYSDNIVVTDVRFPNEAQAIKERGGQVIRIERPGVGPANDHPSETALDYWQFDRVIVNDGSIRDLHDYITSPSIVLPSWSSNI